ncbi:MAG: hypothetical protein ABIH82_02980 [Candidatus Woesearchaeota archaeon]
MFSKKELKEMYDVTKIEEEEFEKKEKNLHNKALMLEYFIEHLNPSALIAVHSTNHFPERGILKPTGHFLFQSDDLKPKQIEIVKKAGLKYPRMTIHFTLNYAVSSIVYMGERKSWNCKYAILIPVKDFIERLVCLYQVDSWIIGPLRLPSSAEILVPEEEYFQEGDKLKTIAGRAQVVPYPKRKKLIEAIELRIRKKGYSYIEGSDHGWMKGLGEFISESSKLSFEEKTRLKQLCEQKGLLQWAMIFEKLKQEIGFTSINHESTIWRTIEKYVELVYNIMFTPGEEPKELKVEYFKDSIPNIRGIPTLPSMRRTLLIHAKTVKNELEKKRYNNDEEKRALLNLMIELNRMERWLKSINEKIDIIPKEEEQTITWEEFLKKENMV